MINVSQTNIFEKWIIKLKDRRAKAKIEASIDRMKRGNLGTVRFLGEGVFEKKINCGPGYRLYFTNDKENLILLLCGGDKSTQRADIKQAQEIRKELND
jgi:putative addiction module killer protein